MKYILSVALPLLFCVSAVAQNIKRIEYFFDTDPGAGKAKPLTITASDTVKIITDIPVNNLAAGLHTLYMRSKTDTGWGPTENFLFTVSDPTITLPLVKEEYFFDNDPGTGKATPITINQADTISAKQILVAGNLSEGLHTLYIRISNSAGYYSLTESTLFYVTSFAANAAKISRAEYFIDTDPGAGKGKTLATGALSDTLRKSYQIKPPAGLDAAINHYVCIRVKDQNGDWSLYAVDTFKITSSFASLKINAARNGDNAIIDWNVDSGDVAGYTIERSVNGIDFTPFEDIAFKPETKAYTAKDIKPVAGLNFYHIKQITTAGDISYSNIAKVLFDTSTDRDITVYPNPAKDIVNIRFNAGGKTVFVNIFDALGRWIKIHTVAAGANVQLNVSDLARGTYILQVSNGEKTGTTKMVKQ